VRDALRRVAPDRQRAGDRLAGELVAEAGLVAVAFDGHRLPHFLAPSPNRLAFIGVHRRDIGASASLAFRPHQITARRAHLVALDGLEQRLEVALAEALVALALDDLEEDRADALVSVKICSSLRSSWSPDRRRSGCGSSRRRARSSPWFGMRWSITSK
jgi:hypothetical protein